MFLEQCVVVRLPLAMFARVLLRREMFARNVPIQIMRLAVCVRAADKRTIEGRLMEVHVEHDVLDVHIRFVADAAAMSLVRRAFVQFFRAFDIRQMRIVEMLNEVHEILE